MISYYLDNVCNFRGLMDGCNFRANLDKKVKPHL